MIRPWVSHHLFPFPTKPELSLGDALRIMGYNYPDEDKCGLDLGMRGHRRNAIIIDEETESLFYPASLQLHAHLQASSLFDIALDVRTLWLHSTGG